MRARVLLALAVAAIIPAPQPHTLVITRVFPQPGQIGLFIANADGSDEHPLVAPADIDYDAAWSPDGGSIVFTSERNGSADLVSREARTAAASSGSPTVPPTMTKRRSLPMASNSCSLRTRADGTADLWTLDVATQARESADVRARRRFPSVLVAGRPVDRVLVRSH